MALHEFEKEESLQRALLRDRINNCDLDHYQDLAQDAARIAQEQFFRIRFGAFQGTQRSIVYANMGSNNAMARERFRRALDEAGVQELAVVVWPLAETPDAHYTWAVLIDTPDADRWVDVAIAAWSAENTSKRSLDTALQHPRSSSPSISPPPSLSRWRPATVWGQAATAS